MGLLSKPDGLEVAINLLEKEVKRRRFYEARNGAIERVMGTSDVELGVKFSLADSVLAAFNSTRRFACNKLTCQTG